MLTRFIWKPETTVKKAARRVLPVWPSNLPGGMAGKVWKWSGSRTSFTACHSGSHIGCHIGSMSQEQESSSPRSPSLAARCTSATAASMSP